MKGVIRFRQRFSTTALTLVPCNAPNRHATTDAGQPTKNSYNNRTEEGVIS